MTPSPYVTFFDLRSLPSSSTSRKGGNVLVISCDGVSDVLEDEEVVEIMKKGMEESGGKGAERGAVRVRDEAYLKGSMDDISVVGVVLG